MESDKTKLSNFNFENLIDTLIRLAVLFLLISWCFNIIRPFTTIIVWSTVITIAVFPVYSRMTKLLRGRKVIASVIITLIMLSFLVVPSWLITVSMIDGIAHIRDLYQQGMPLIPAPGETTKNWPAFAKPIVDLWSLASENLQAVTLKFKDQLEVAATWFFKALTGVGKGILQFVGSIILAGVFLIYSEPIGKSMLKIFNKLSGKNGANIANLSVVTVRNVLKGVLGVAFIQSTLATIGFFIVGVPYAGLWAVLCLITAIVQLGVGPVSIPIAIYMFTVTDTVTATIFAIWIVIVSLSDNVLKPILMGKGAAAPMLVIFLGSIGGFIYAGFIGLFLGAIALAIGYKLFMTWLDSENFATVND